MVVELHPDLDWRLRRVAAAQRITVEEALARAVRDYCRRRGIALDQMRQEQ